MKPTTPPRDIDEAVRLPQADSPANSDALTPRGGFMARPGLKAPPTHAVVVRSGDVPLSDHIPLGRPSSVPPSARSSVPPAANRREQDTQKAVPKPGYRPALPIQGPAESEIPKSPAVTSLESSPPPSDGPVVASIPAPALEKRRDRLPTWTIAAAAAAGLIVGLGSVATSLWLGRSNTAAASAAATRPFAQALASSPGNARSDQQLSRPKPEPGTPISVAPSAEPSRTAASASTRGVAVPPARRTIF